MVGRGARLAPCGLGQAQEAAAGPPRGCPTTKEKDLFWIDSAEVDANVNTLAVAGINTTKDLFTTEILDKL